MTSWLYRCDGGTMHKKIVRVALKAVLIAFILIAMALLLRDSSHQLSETARYDATAPVAVKFPALARWLPPDAELIVVIDPQHLFSVPGVKAKLVANLKGAADMWDADLSALVPMFVEEPAIGLVAAAVRLGLPGEPASGVFIMQGRVNEEALVMRVDEQLALQSERLDRSRVGDIEVYMEFPPGSAFAFALPDRTHLMLAQKDELERIIQSAVERGAEQESDAWPTPPSGTALFGWFTITPRLQALLPDQLKGLKGAHFSSDAHLNVEVTIPVTTLQEKNDLVLFIEGLRISYLITSGAESILAAFLREIRIDHGEGEVVVRLPLAKLL